MIRGDDVNAWFFPNSGDAGVVGKTTLDAHMVTVKWIEGKVGITVPIPDTMKATQPRAPWRKPGWRKGKVLG